MSAMIWRSAAVTIVLTVAGGQVPCQKPPPPVDPRVSGGLDLPRPPVLAVEPPAPLTRSALLDRLRKLDPTIPNALPPGASVVLTPANLRNGRTFLGIFGAEHVGMNQRGAAVAEYRYRPGASAEILYITFDASGPSRYAVDIQVTGTTTSNPGGGFDISVGGPATTPRQRVPIADDGRVQYIFSVPRGGRYTIYAYRQAEREGREEWWILHRVELLRVQ